MLTSTAINGLHHPNNHRRRLVLVSLEWHKERSPSIALASSCLASAIQESQVAEIEVLVGVINNPEFSLEKLACEILDRSPTDIGIGCYVWNKESTRHLMKHIRKRGYAGRIILGGPQVSNAGPGLEKVYPEADIFIRGTAEDALVEVITAHNPSLIQGVHVAGTEDSCAQALAQLTHLASPYLSRAISLTHPDGSPLRFIWWETKRGCPFRCSYCQHPGSGDRVQHHFPIRRLRDEIVMFKDNGVQEVAVLDPTFNIGEKYLEVLYELQRQKFEGLLGLECRFELVNEQFLDAVQGLNVRLKFGLQTIHKDEEKAIRRKNNLSKIQEVIVELNRRNLLYLITIMYGLPNQTLQSFTETVDFCLGARVPVVRAFPLLLLRGTELAASRKKWRLETGPGSIPEVISSNSFTERDHKKMVRIAEALKRTEGQHPSSANALCQREPGHP